MCTVLPLVVDPDLPIELATMTPMYGGSGAAGGEVLPPSADNQVVPHAAVVLPGANPLKAGRSNVR